MKNNFHGGNSAKRRTFGLALVLALLSLALIAGSGCAKTEKPAEPPVPSESDVPALTDSKLFEHKAFEKRYAEKTQKELLEVSELYIAGEKVYDMPVHLYASFEMDLLDLDSYFRGAEAAPTEPAKFNDREADASEKKEGPLSDVTDIAKFENLEKLSLQRQQITDATPVFGLKNLTYLDLGWNPITSLEGIGALENLEELRIENVKVTDLSPIFECKKLKYLFITNADVDSFEGIEKLTELEGVFFDNIKIGTQDITPLFKCGNLEYVQADNCNYTSIEGIGELKKVRYLSIGGTMVEDMSPAGQCPKLEFLCITGLYVKDISGLADSTSLVDIGGNKLNNVRDYSALKKIPTLENVFIWTGELVNGVSRDDHWIYNRLIPVSKNAGFEVYVNDSAKLNRKDYYKSHILEGRAFG